MSKRILAIRKSVLPKLLLLILSIVIISVGTFSSIPTHADSTTTVYLDQPTINGTAIGEKFSVNINIRDAPDTSSWMAGIIFNASLLNCTCFEEGTFLKNVGPTTWVEGPINNTLGVITAHGAAFLGDYKASGDGQLAYLNFTVKALGVSDLHLRDAIVVDYDFNVVPTNIIDDYTVVVEAIPHTVVTVSNSSGSEEMYSSGFYDHAFSLSDKELSFKVTGPYNGFSIVTIPKALLPSPVPPYEWAIIVDNIPTSISLTDNTTHTFISFTYSEGIHSVQITTRFVISTISMTLNPTSINVGSSVTISGAIDPARENVSVTILYRQNGGDWTFLANVTTNSNGNYSHAWTPEEAGTYEVKASWKGDPTTLGNESDTQPLTVKEAAAVIPLEYIVAAVVVIIIIVAVVFYVKIRKPEEE